MENDLISRQVAIDALSKAMPSLTTPDGCGELDHDIYIAQETVIDDMRIINDLPSAQPEIIRCKDCKYIAEHHYEENGEPPYIKYTCAYKAGLAKGYQVHEWDFCSRAERREDEKTD